MGICRSKQHQQVHPIEFNEPQTKYAVVWLDANAIDSDPINQNSLSYLRCTFISLDLFTNVKDCLKYLSTYKDNQIIMLISTEFFEKVSSSIQSMSQIQSIYILSSSMKMNSIIYQDFNKIQGVFSQIEYFSRFLQRANKPMKSDCLLMSTIPSITYSKKGLQDVNNLFIYWMLTKQILLENKYENNALKDMTTYCRMQYYGNVEQLKHIDEFERNYHHHSPIWWYTKETFLFDLLNQAFQTQDIEIIIRMGFFIKDLYQQLDKIQIDTAKTQQFPIIVYRNHQISKEDFEKMKTIKGNLLSFNNFIIAASDYQTSVNSIPSRTEINLIFRIKIESKQSSSPYAFLRNISFSTNQSKSILFSMHSIFRIDEMKQIEDYLWQIDLTLTEVNDQQIISLDDLLKSETQDSTSWIKLAQLMKLIHVYDKAKDIYYVLLNSIADTDPLKMAYIYNELGILYDEIGDYTSALLFYQKAIDIRQEHLPRNHRSISISYNNMGEVQRQMGDYFNALSTHKKTLDIKQKTLPPNDLSFATTYNNIGLTSELLGDFPTALSFYQKALEIKRKTFSNDHQELATTYNNIGELQRAMGNFTAALTSLEKALQIRLKHVSPTNPSLAIIYNNIGLIHQELGDFPKAISYLEKSLDVKLKSFPTNHPSLAFSYNNIGTIHHQMGHFSQALLSYKIALDIQEKTLNGEHPELAVTYTNIGISYQAMGNYPEARSYYEKALYIRQKSFPPNHPLLGVSYNNLGHFHQLIGEYYKALEYYERTLKLQKKSLCANHPSIAATYNNLADIHRKLEDYKKALMFCKISLDIKKKSLPTNHPALIITYNNMGSMNQALKKYSLALECYKQTLEIQQKTLPSDHPDLAAVYNNMGVSHQSMKEYTTALDCYKKALSIQNRSLLSNHPDIAVTYNSMAAVLVCLGDYQDALEHEKRAIDIASQSLPVDHPRLVIFRDYYERIDAKVKSMKNEQVDE